MPWPVLATKLTRNVRQHDQDAGDVVAKPIVPAVWQVYAEQPGALDEGKGQPSHCELAADPQWVQHNEASVPATAAHPIME